MPDARVTDPETGKLVLVADLIARRQRDEKKVAETPKEEVKEEWDTQDEDLIEATLVVARDEYKELYGKDVANNMKNNLEWIQDKIQQKRALVANEEDGKSDDDND